MIVIDHLYRIALEHPQRLAFVSGKTKYTYSEMARLVDQIACLLTEKGCLPGTPVAVLSPNDPLAFACVLGVLRAGACWVPINQRNSPTANADFLKHVGCRTMFFHGSLRDDIEIFQRLLPDLQTLLQIDGSQKELGTIANLLGQQKKQIVKAMDDIDRISIIVGTGGTTGAPKAVTWTESTWRALLAAATESMPVCTPPVHLCVAPMTHAAGVLAMMLMPDGATSITMDRVDPLEIMKRIQEEQITHLYLPPTLLYLMLGHPEVRNFNYSSLKYFLITAAPVAPHRLIEATRVFGPVMAQCYGQSEAPMLCTFFPPFELGQAAANGDIEKLASCGRPTSGVEVGVMSPSGDLLKPGEIGEIVVRGELVMRGYLNDPEATKEVSAYGWHHTGDIGRVDESEFVYIMDRKKDMIISGGFNVYPGEVEKIILTNSAVRDCAVIGVPHDKWGEAVKAVIELKDGKQTTETEILALCRGALGGVKTPKSVEFVDQLPRSAAGKVLKRELRSVYWTGKSQVI